jgi:hypothetical protein
LLYYIKALPIIFVPVDPIPTEKTKALKRHQFLEKTKPIPRETPPEGNRVLNPMSI